MRKYRKESPAIPHPINEDMKWAVNHLNLERNPASHQPKSLMHISVWERKKSFGLVLCLLIEDALRKQVASLPASVGVHAAQHFGHRAAC